MKKMTIFLGLALLFVSPMYANDDFAPFWRGSAGTAKVVFDFSDPNTFNDGDVDPTSPDFALIETATAQAGQEFGTDACSVVGPPARAGVLVASEVRALVTNLAAEGETVVVRVQITSTAAELPFTGIESANSTFDQPDFELCEGAEDLQLEPVGPAVDHGDGYSTSAIEAVLPAGAGCGLIQVFFEGFEEGTCVDEIIIDIQHSTNPGQIAVATATPASVQVQEFQGGSGITQDMVIALDPNVGSVSASGSVVVTLDPNTTQVTLNGVSSLKLTFTDTDWTTPQTVTVAGVEDTNFEACVSSFVFQAAVESSSDAHFDQGAAQVPLQIDLIDEDNGCVFVEAEDTELNELLSEADTGSLVYSLNRAPSSGSVFIAVDDSFEDPNSPYFKADPNVLTFTTSNWAIPQTVTLNPQQDDELRGTAPGSGEPSVTTAISTVSVSSPGDNFFVNPDPETQENLNAPAAVEISITEDECGAQEFGSVDFNQDCFVDISDLSSFVEEWLGCSTPGC